MKGFVTHIKRNHPDLAVHLQESDAVLTPQELITRLDSESEQDRLKIKRSQHIKERSPHQADAQDAFIGQFKREKQEREALKTHLQEWLKKHGK